MRGKNWDEFPIQQKWFAIGETISHLDYLIKRNKITRHEENGATYYTANIEQSGQVRFKLPDSLNL